MLQACSTFLGHEHWVHHVELDQCGILGVSCSWDKTVQVWRSDDASLVMKGEGHKKRIRCCTFTSDSHSVVSGSTDETLKIWDIQSGSCMSTIASVQCEVETCSVSSSCVLGAGSQPHIFLWDMSSGQLMKQFSEHSRPVTQVLHTANRVPSSSSDMFWSVSFDGTAKQWDSRLGASVSTVRSTRPGIRSFDLSFDGVHCALGANDKTLSIFDVRSVDQGPLQTITHKGYVFSCSFSPNARSIATGAGNPDYRVYVWDTCNGELQQMLPGNWDHVSSVSWRHDTLAVGSTKHKVIMYRAVGQQQQQLDTADRKREGELSVEAENDSEL